MNENENQKQTEQIVGDGNRGIKFVIGIAAGMIAMNIFFTIWDAVDGYSIISDIFGIIFSIVVGLIILSGQPWMRYLFVGLCCYNAFFRVLNLIFIIGEMSTQELNWFLLIIQSVLLLYYVVSAVLLLTNKDVKAYFTPEE